MASEEVDVGAVVDHLCQLMGQFAIPHEAVKGYKHNVGVRLPKDPKHPVIDFRFMHPRLFIVDVKVDAAGLFADPGGYLQRLVDDLMQEIERACAADQEANRIVIRNAGRGLH